MLLLSAGLIIVAAVLVSSTVSDHLATTATDATVRTTSAVVHAYVDPIVVHGDIASPTPAVAAGVDRQLAALTASKQILRIKIWSPSGTVLYSDLPALIGQSFPVDDSLSDALAGQVATDYSSPDEAENVFERGLASEFLSIYLPIEVGGRVVGAYEVYEDAAPIEAQIGQTRQDVMLIVGGMALGLFLLLFGAFTVTSRLMARQNRRLRDQAANEQILATDLRRSEERFRSLVQNSADVVTVLRADGVIAYESPAVERVLGYRPDDRVGSQALAYIHPDDLETRRELLDEVMRVPGAQVSVEFRSQHRDGSWRMIEGVAQNLLQDPAVRGLVLNYRDVTERRALTDELEHRAFHDSLTGLANRGPLRGPARPRPGPTVRSRAVAGRPLP